MLKGNEENRVRDRIKDEKYFYEAIARDEERLRSFQTKLSNGSIAASRIEPVERTVYQIMRDLWKDKYSLGEPIKNLVAPFEAMLRQYLDHWVPEWYYDVLSCLSIGIMLDIDDMLFNELVARIQQSQRNDWLYNFLINYRVSTVSYQNTPLLYAKPYQAIKDVVESSGNKVTGLKDYLEKKWYQGNKSAGWYDSHTSKFDTYTGYWCFEAGAVAKILALDDVSLKDVPYYPYDLVHYSK